MTTPIFHLRLRMLSTLLALGSPTMPVALDCTALCDRLRNDEPRTALEKKLDAVAYDALKACVTRERGRTGTVRDTADAAAFARGMKKCEGVDSKACVAACVAGGQ